VQVAAGVTRQLRPLLSLRRREPPLGGWHDTVEVGLLQGCGERDPEHGGDDYLRPKRHPRSPYPDRHDRLVQGYDDHEAVALSQVPGVDPEARDVEDERHAVGDRQRHSPERALSIPVEENLATMSCEPARAAAAP